MAESFSVGEIAILQNCSNAKYNGGECVILGLPRPHRWDCGNPDNGSRYIRAGEYWTESDGKTWSTPPNRLRKKRPPQQREATSSWDDVIVWRPKETEHV